MYLAVDENDIKSLVSTIPLTYVRTEGGRRKTGERIETIVKCESTKVRKYQAFNTLIKRDSTQLQSVALRGNAAAVMGAAPSWNLGDII